MKTKYNGSPSPGKFIIGILIFFVVAILLCPAEEPMAQRDFGFGNMEIFQFKNDTAYLTTRDLNNDGLEDILFLNNRASRLEVLIRLDKPSSGEELPRLKERFVNKGFVLDQWTKAFQVADVNSDQRLDIISVGDQLGLVVYLRQPDGSFGEAATQFVKDAAKLVNLTSADLNGDSYIDILICRKETADILWNNGKGEFKTQSGLAFSSTGCLGAIVADINGDKLQDLLFYFGTTTGALRVRLGLGKGEFGWEETLLLPAALSLRNVELGEAAANQLAVLLKNGLILRLYGFNQKKQGHLLDQVAVAPRRLPLMGVSRKEPPTWLAADFNKDGSSDFCVAAPLLSQVHLYFGTPSGLQPVPQQIDSLNAIKTLKRTGRGDLVVFSAAEKAVALHQAENLARFPIFGKTPGKPLAMDVGLPSTIFTVCKDKEYQLVVFDAEKFAQGPVQTHELSIPNAPQEIMAVPLAAKNNWMIILFMAYERPEVFQLQGETLTRMQPENFRAMSLNLESKAVTGFNFPKEPQVLVSEGGVARLYQWQEGKFAVKRQLTPGRKSARLAAACLYPDQKNKPGYLVYDEDGQDLLWFSTAEKRPPIPIYFEEGLKDIVGLAPLTFKDRGGLLLVGLSEVQWLQEGGSTLSLKTLAEYSSKSENPAFWTVYSVTMGNPGRPMLAMLDSTNRSIELVGKHGQELTEELVFEVFQDPGFLDETPEYEPHAIGSGDFNGDHIQDLAVLVHDKLIIYLGE